MTSPGLIALLEDDSAVATLALAALQQVWPSASYHLTTTLVALLGGIQETLPDLCVLDLYVPDSHGLETLHEVLRWIPPPVPLIVMSGYLTPLEGYKALEAGASGVVLKGIGSLTTSLREESSKVWATRCGLQRRLIWWADKSPGTLLAGVSGAVEMPHAE